MKSAIEVGTFTGYSSLCIARAMPPKGRLICVDASREWTDIARKYWARAGVQDRIDLRLGPAIPTLKRLEPGLRFDFAFIDAAKTEYDAYYELILPRVRRNGLILFDNMLSAGRVGTGRAKEDIVRAIEALNHKLANDRALRLSCSRSPMASNSAASGRKGWCIHCVPPMPEPAWTGAPVPGAQPRPHATGSLRLASVPGAVRACCARGRRTPVK